MDLFEKLLILVVAVIGINHVEGAKKGWFEMIITGCTETYVQMDCPGDDILSVADVRIETTNSSEPCKQVGPAKDVAVPKDMAHLCDPAGEHCVYLEDICEGQNECAFYISPHLIDEKIQPTEDSEVLIEYRCMPGKGRQGGPILLGLMASVGTLAMAIVGGIILFREFKDVGQTSNYNNFNNENSQGAQPQPQPTMTFANNTNAGYDQPSGPENINVQMQVTGDMGEGAATPAPAAPVENA